jgi:hypothetical protein
MRNASTAMAMPSTAAMADFHDPGIPRICTAAIVMPNASMYNFFDLNIERVYQN